MEGRKEKIFPWIKDVLQSFASSFMVDYDSDVLSTLHRNIDKEINMIYSSNDRTIERTEALYKEITYIYEHMRLKINQHPEFQNATLSCVKLISQLIRVGLILTQGLINSEWIERILTALELFPGQKVLVYDALFLVNGLKKIHQKPYCAILRHIMTEDHHEFVTDPLVYMEIILLFRRLKALVLNRYKEKYNILVTKIKPPSNLISWLASLDVNGYSPYLKKLKYKKIAQQLMKKALPESFIKKIRYMALNQYNFEIDDSELKITETKNQPSCMFIIDNTLSTKCDNLDMLENSLKAVTKRKTNSQARRKRKKLLLNENIENDENSQSDSENKTSNICIKESGTDNNNRKHFSKSNKHTIVSKKKQKSYLSNSNERIGVSKKKKKSKSNLVKISKSETSTNISKDVSDSDLFFQDVEGSTLLHDIDGSALFQVNKSTLNPEDPESSSENKISILYINESDRNIASNKHSNFMEHLTVSKKKKKLKSKNTKSCPSETLNRDVSNSDLFFHDVENSSISEQLSKNTLNDKNPESSSEIKFSSVYIGNSDTDQTTHKHFPSSNEHIIVSKKKKKSKCNLIKNTDSELSAIHSEDVPDSALFFHDVEGSSNSKKLKTTYNVSNFNISSKRDLSEDTDTLGKNVSKNKNSKKLKSSKYDERTISDNSLSNSNKLDSNIVPHQQVMSENKNKKQQNSFKDGEDIFESEISAKKRKNITSKGDSASYDKCFYFKKLMLQKVSDKSKTTSKKISNEQENINSAATVDDNSKLPDIKEKNKNVFVNITESTPCENQSVRSENVGVKNVEEENVVINESLSVTENTVGENKTVPLKNVANESFEERNDISDVPSDHSDKFNDSVHPQNIDNLSTEKENILIVQSSGKPKLLKEPKTADESSTLGARTQTTEESNKNIVDNLNSELIEEDNLVKNKQFDVLLLKSDHSIASVSNVECKDVENKHNMKESRETLKSNQIANDESEPSIDCPRAKDVSENIPVPSQNVNVKNNENSTPEKDMHSNKYAFNITDSAGLPITSEDIANQIQQISDPNTCVAESNTCVAESNTSVDSSSCEDSIITQRNENFNTFSVEKTSYSTTLDETSCKANLKSVDTQVSLEHENQKHVSAVQCNILPPTSPLDSKQSEGKSLLNDSHTKNVVNNEHCVENSSVVESESKLEFKENSTENIFSNKSFDKACLKNIDKDSTPIDEVSENNNLHSIDQQDKSVQNMQSNVNTKSKLEKSIDTGTDVAGDSENCEYKAKCVEITHVSPEEHDVCFDNKKIEENCFKENSPECESSKSLNIKEKLVITEVSVSDTQIKHDDISMNLSIKTAVSDKEDSEIGPKPENVKIANQKCVEIETEFEATQKNLHLSENKEVYYHVADNAEHSVISTVKEQEEKSEKKDAQALGKLNDEKISSMLVNETYVHKNSVQLKNVDFQNDIISNENNEGIVSNENILVSNELASLDTVSNSVNDVKISVKEKEYTLQVVESEKIGNVCENSEKISVVNSQNDVAKDNKNSKGNLSNEITLSPNESACSDNICNSANNVETSLKVESQSLLESKNVVITCENSSKLKVVNSQDDIISNENIPSSNECSNKINNLSDDVKTSIEITDSTIHSLPLIEKPTDASGNSGMFKAVNSQDESILDNENYERNSSSENIPSSRESTSSDNICNSANEVKIVDSTNHLLPVIENTINACENSDQLNSIHSRDIKNNEKSLLNEKLSSAKGSSSLDKIDNLAHNVKIAESTIHLLPVSEKTIDACKNSDQLNSIKSQNDSPIDIKNNEKDLKENISFLKQSTSSDNIDNLANNVKTVKSTVHLLPVTEKPIDVCENSGQLNSINSQNDSPIDIKNNERDLSKENISPLKESIDNIENLASSVKTMESTIHLLPVIEKPIDTCENSDQLKAVNFQNDTLLSNKKNFLDENIQSSKECSGNINNSANDVKVPGEITKDTIHSVPVIEKHIVAYENSDKLKAGISQDDNVTSNENNEKNLLNENSSSPKECSDNLNDSANDVKVSNEIIKNAIHSLPVIEKPIDACENSDQLKAVNSQNDTLLGNKKNFLDENVQSLKECSDNINNSANDVKVPGEITKDTIHSVPVIEKPIVACENSNLLKVVNSQDSNENNEKDLPNKNILSQKESTSSDNIHNSENDVKISDEPSNNTFPTSPLIEQFVDTCESSYQLNVVNSQNGYIRDDENSEKGLSNDKDAASSVKEKEDSMQLLESKNVEETPLNVENTSSGKIAIEIKTSNLFAKSNLNECEKSCERMSKDNEHEKSCERMSNDNEREKSCERMSNDNECEKSCERMLKDNECEKSCERMLKDNGCEKSCERMSKDNEREKSCEKTSKDNESDADCNFDFQERYIVLDESYSDVDDCKSNYSEQSNENSSPLKKAVTATNKSKFKSPSRDPSCRHLCENYNEQIEPIAKENICEVSLQKGTNEMDSIISPIEIDATNKSEIKSDISSGNDNSNHLHEKDTSEISHGNYANDMDNTTSPVNAVVTNESKIKGDISSIEDKPKNSCLKDDHQIKPILKKDTSEKSHENCASEIDSKDSHESILSDIKKDLSLTGNGLEHSLVDSNSKEKLISAVQSQCSSSVLEIESSKKDIKFAEISEQTVKRMKRKSIEYPSEISESISVPSFCGDENRESFTEISLKNKDKSLDVKSVASVSINQFPYDPATEFFSKYKNKPANDADNKPKASLSSRDQSFTEIPFKDKDKDLNIESVCSVTINNFSSASSTELCKNKMTNDEDNKAKAPLSSSDQSFREIPFKDKDKDLNNETVGSVSINNFSSSTAASTESYGMYRNELTNDEDNKTEASLSSRDDILSNCQENDEIKSQTFSSDHSDDDRDSRSSSQEEKENSADDTVIPSEDCNDQSKTIDESLSFKNIVPSTAETENDSLDNKNCAKDKSLSSLNVSDSLGSAHEKNSVTSVLPRQSLRLKTKSESKCQTDAEEISTSDISKIQVSNKELKLVLIDCKSNLKSENDTNNLSIENTISCPLSHDNKEDIISSQTSVTKMNASTAKDKSKKSSTDCNKSAKRYSLRHRKSNRSTGDSVNLGIDLNKLKFDSPKCSRSTRGLDYVKCLTSPSDDIKLKDNPSDVMPSKRETRSSAKSDVGIEPNTPSYNLRNRRTILAPPKFNV